MYNKEQYDHIFYRMRKSIPNGFKLFLLVVIIKLYPLFLLAHTGGYTVPKDSLSTIHSYFRNFSIAYYLQNSFGGKGVIILIWIIFTLNILCLLSLIYYLAISIKVKKIDENYGNIQSLGYPFYIFSNFSFFKYIILFQFFQEINFLPLLCINGFPDYQKISENSIFGNSNIKTFNNNLCNKSNIVIVLFLSCANFLIDIGFYFLITSRFFDFNILSEYQWNFAPENFLSFEFLESLSQIFFIMFLNFDNKKFKLIFNIYVIILLLAHLYKKFKRKNFYTSTGYIYVYITDYAKMMCYMATIFIAIFQFGSNKVPNDVNVVGMIIFEGILVFLIKQFEQRNDSLHIKKVLVNSLQQLNEKNIYATLIFLIKEFNKFSDISYKFSDSNLDLFLENYVNHLKICEDRFCPCKNYVRKVIGASNTVKSGYTTVINFTHIKKDKQEEYILNKFFNVLAANINTSIKFTNNVNLNNIEDSQRQKLIYQLRIKLITAVKKLLSYKLEKLTKDIEGPLSNQFSKQTKDFIRINFFAVNIFCNKSYYKTQFLYFEFLSEYLKRRDRSYHFNLIYYFYLKQFSIKEYNAHLNTLKQNRKETSSGGFHLDFRTVLSLCVKYYEIEEKLINTALNYRSFIEYFSTDKIYFDKLLKLIKKFKGNYTNVASYLIHYFKNDKISNLFVCTKIILFFKILHFEIPEILHNKLIIQVHDEGENNKMHSYNDSNYYIIINYINGEFIIKFISHELLIVLEYSEEELRDQDFHILMPDKLRQLHLNVVIGEIKTKGNAYKAKEVFFVSKRRISVLFDMQYKFLLNLKGEITMLTVAHLKKPSKDFKVCFACIDDHGEVLALNREFEDYLVLSMKVLEYVKIDTEKVILQNMGARMRNFFKDEENTDFQEQFDYEMYLSSLFGEEFEVLKEKNEREYRKKYQRWEALKEINRKGRYYTRYIELNIKQRTLGKEKIYFLKYSVKITLSLKSLEPHSTTLSLIHAVKMSKKEMAKLNFYRGDEVIESKSEKSLGEEKANESVDDLFESQSQISSAISQLKEKNSVRLFKQRRNAFKFLPKNRNILFLMISICALSIISVIYNIISLIIKTDMYNKTQKYLILDMNSIFLKKNIFLLSTAMTTMDLLDSKIIEDNNTNKLPINMIDNLKNAIATESLIMNEVIYNITFLSSQFFNRKIDEILNKELNMTYIFNNGYIFTKYNVNILQEIYNIEKEALDMLALYNDESFNSNSLENSVMYKYFLNDKITSIKDDMEILPQDEIVFFIMKNLFGKMENYIDKLIIVYNNHLNQNEKIITNRILAIKIIEFVIVGIIICIEWIFIFFGYEKSKKKMIRLRQKIEKNNIISTLKKIEEFINFSNNFNINSLYYIADLDLKKIDEINKISDQIRSSSKSLINLSPSSLSKKKNSSNSANANLNSNSNAINELSTPTGDVSLLSKPLSKFQIDNDKNPQSVPDGKRNLLKVMQKLDKIKGIKKPKELDVKNTDNSNQQENIEENINNDNINNNNINKNENNFYPNDNESSLKVNEYIDKKNTSEQIKPVLRTSGTRNSGNIKFISDENVHLNPQEEDSKVAMLKQSDGGIGLVSKRQSRATKVQFKEKNVRYYSPGQNISEGDPQGQFKLSKMDKRELNKVLLKNEKNKNKEIKGENNNDSSNLYKYQSNNNNFDGNDKSLLNEINQSSNSLPGFAISKEKVSFSLNNKKAINTPTPMENNENQISDMGENQLNKFQLLEQEKAVTVKVKKNSNEKELTKKEVIAEKIENVIHNNMLARIILNLTLAIFITLYIANIIFNFVYKKEIKNGTLYTHLLFNKTILINMIVMKYQFILIEGKQDEMINDYLYQADINKIDISDFEVHNSPNILPTVFDFENKIRNSNSCEYFSELYSKMFDTEYEDEYEECINVGEKMNENGFSNAESYVLSTMTVLVADWKNLGNPVSDKQILDKINDRMFFNLVCEIEYVFRKYTRVLMLYVLKDVDRIFNKIIFNEKIFGYFSIGLNIIFLILSLIFIIYPIKSVEIMITWLSHKIIKN